MTHHALLEREIAVEESLQGPLRYFCIVFGLKRNRHFHTKVALYNVRIDGVALSSGGSDERSMHKRSWLAMHKSFSFGFGSIVCSLVSVRRVEGFLPILISADADKPHQV
jgi:hypothetical protein